MYKYLLVLILCVLSLTSERWYCTSKVAIFWERTKHLSSSALGTLSTTSRQWNTTRWTPLHTYFCNFLKITFVQATGQLSVSFRNMSLKKIKRAEKKGTESVMDEKFALLFWSEFSIGNGEFHHQVSLGTFPFIWRSRIRSRKQMVQNSPNNHQMSFTFHFRISVFLYKSVPSNDEIQRNVIAFIFLKCTAPPHRLISIWFQFD